MEKIYITIEKSVDHYGAYSENCDCIFAGGNNVDELKANVLEAIKLIKQSSKNVPEILKGEYEIIYKFDMPSFLKYYSKVLSLAGLERLTGVNQGQLSHYITGRRNPSEKTKKRIIKALHNFADEISQVEFV